MRRFQFKADPAKPWGDAGPDLLRTRKNARRALDGDLGADAGWFVRVTDRTGDWRPWTGPHTKAAVLEAFGGWNPADKVQAQYGRKVEGKTEARGAVRCRVIEVRDYANSTPQTNTVIALCKTFNPSAAFGGAQVCKRVAGSSTYSQHAYGKAYDHSAYARNDRDTDWALRMARLNRADDVVFPVWQVLGSKAGRAGNASGDTSTGVGPYEWKNGGVDDSHEWHVHISTIAKGSGLPACAGRTFEVDPDLTQPHDAADAETDGG